MADFGVFIGFGTPVRGREEGAVKVFSELMEYLGAQAQQGNVESFEPVLLQPHGGELGGFVLVRGERGKLDAVVASDEFTRVMTRAQIIVENMGIVNCFLDQELQRQMGSVLEDTTDLRA